MPFPLAAVGAMIVSGLGSAAAAAGAVAATVGTVATAGLAAGTAATVIGGTILVGGGIVTAAAISVYNDNKREEARERARRQASKERERILLEQKRECDRKIKELQEKHGEKIPKEELEPLLDKKVVNLSELEGNSLGLKEQGISPDEEADSAAAELDALKAEKGGLAA